jgi:hypothetical protein
VMGDDDLDLLHVGHYRGMTTDCRRIYRQSRPDHPFAWIPSSTISRLRPMSLRLPMPCTMVESPTADFRKHYPDSASLCTGGGRGSWSWGVRHTGGGVNWRPAIAVSLAALFLPPLFPARTTSPSIPPFG